MKTCTPNSFSGFIGSLAVTALFTHAVAAQGIPEPDLVLYGVVLNVYSNANLRLGYDTLTWVFQPVGGGPQITASTTLTNINDQFSYILRIPCETPVSGFSLSSNTIQLTATGMAFDRSQVTWKSNRLTFVQSLLTNSTFSATDRGRIERVDLEVSFPILDLDGNGLPDDWERLYFGRTDKGGGPGPRTEPAVA